MSDFEAMDATVKKMRRAGWAFTLSSGTTRRDYTASFTKTIQTSKPGGPKRRESIGGVAEALTMPDAVCKAAENALAYEADKTPAARQAGS